MIHLRLAAGAIVLAFSFAPMVRADLIIGSIGSAVVTFDTAGVTDTGNGPHAGAGFNSTPGSGQLDSDSWAVSVGASTLGFGGTAGSGVFGRGSSGVAVTTTGIYSFDVDNGAGTDNALGTKLDKDVTSATITLRVKNNTGNNVSTWNVGYDAFGFNNGDRATSISFSYSTNDVSYSTPTLLFSSNDVASGTQWSSAVPKATQISASVLNGNNLYLRWSLNIVGSGNQIYDQVAIDNISVAVVPEPGALLFGGLACGVVGLGVGGRKLKHKFFARG